MLNDKNLPQVFEFLHRVAGRTLGRPRIQSACHAEAFAARGVPATLDELAILKNAIAHILVFKPLSRQFSPTINQSHPINRNPDPQLTGFEIDSLMTCGIPSLWRLWFTDHYYQTLSRTALPATNYGLANLNDRTRTSR